MGRNKKWIEKVKSDPELYKEFVEERKWNSKKAAFVKRRVSHKHAFTKPIPEESVKLYEELNKGKRNG